MPLQVTTDHKIAQNNFQIIHRSKTIIIKIAEIIVIHKQKPTLNSMESSIPFKKLS